MAKRLRVNVIFSFLNSLITLLFPLITYPYVSRILGPVEMGAYNIAFSVMSYFLLFANLGIPIYAVRAVAKVRNDENEMRKVCSSIVLLHALSTFTVFAVYISYVCIAPNMQSRFWVNFITGFHIVGIFLNVEWFYQGREEFSSITIKNFIVKIISLVLIFVLIRDENDIIIYAAIMIFSVVGYGIFNFIHFLRVCKISFKGMELKSVLKPVLTAFALYAASRLANGLDVIMIDCLLGDSAEYVAGQYGVATKLVNVIIDLLLVVCTVLLPRMSMEIQNGNIEGAKKLSQIVQECMVVFVLPATVGLAFVSKELTLSFFGNAYAPAINTMIVMSFNSFLAVFTNFLGVQIIYAYGKDWFTTISILSGAIVNVVCNLFLIPMYEQLGAAVATIISNGVILIMEAIGAYKWKYLKYITKPNVKSVVATLIMVGGLLLMHFFMHLQSDVLSLIIKVIVSVAIYGIALLILRQESIMYFLNELKRKIKGNKNVYKE